MKRVFIAGGTSSIAVATARIYAGEGAEIVLAARSSERLDAVAADLRVRGARHVHTITVDLSDTSRHPTMLAEAMEQTGGIDVAIIAYGVLGDQQKAAEDFSQADNIIQTNFTSVVSILIRLGNLMTEKGHGTIAVISSVAGDRGRQSNFVYGASKGGLNIFLEGLRNRLYSRGVTVVTVKPGFVDTPMTAEFTKNFLYASPDTIARGIHSAIMNQNDVVYLPWFWRPIMTGIRLLPETFFKRLKL